MKKIVGLSLLGTALILSPTAQAEPPPAQEPHFIPPYLKAGIVADFEGNVSQVLGTQVIFSSMRDYTEQDGSHTTCALGNLNGRPFRLAWGNGVKAVPATKAQWSEAGCNRPNYLLMR